jgi:hypothetical protein
LPEPPDRLRKPPDRLRKPLDRLLKPLDRLLKVRKRSIKPLNRSCKPLKRSFHRQKQCVEPVIRAALSRSWRIRAVLSAGETFSILSNSAVNWGCTPDVDSVEAATLRGIGLRQQVPLLDGNVH